MNNNVFVAGPVFGNKDHFVGLALIADTYSNHNGPHNVCNFLYHTKISQLYLHFSLPVV